MTKFKTISPQEAKQIEDEAVEKFKKQQSQSQKTKQTSDPEKKGDGSKEEQKRSVRSENFPSQKELFHVKAIFPLQFFPDELVVYPDRVVEIAVMAPWQKATRPIDNDDIAQVETSFGPLSAEIKIKSKLRDEDSIVINHLKKDDVKRAKEILQHLMAGKSTAGSAI